MIDKDKRSAIKTMLENSPHGAAALSEFLETYADVLDSSADAELGQALSVFDHTGFYRAAGAKRAADHIRQLKMDIQL
jgi:hypothetical protein